MAKTIKTAKTATRRTAKTAAKTGKTTVRRTTTAKPKPAKPAKFEPPHCCLSFGVGFVISTTFDYSRLSKSQIQMIETALNKELSPAIQRVVTELLPENYILAHQPGTEQPVVIGDPLGSNYKTGQKVSANASINVTSLSDVVAQINKPQKTEPEGETVDLSAMSLSELRELCEAQGLSAKGTKKSLIERLS